MEEKKRIFDQLRYAPAPRDSEHGGYVFHTKDMQNNSYFIPVVQLRDIFGLPYEQEAT